MKPDRVLVESYYEWQKGCNLVAYPEMKETFPTVPEGDLFEIQQKSVELTTHIIEQMMKG